MNAVIQVFKEQRQVSRMMVGSDSFTIGRVPGQVDLVLDDKAVSSRHARIDRREGRFVLSDLESRNGTLVNGKEVKTPRELAAADRIEIGPYTLVFHLDVETPDGEINGVEPEVTARAAKAAGAEDLSMILTVTDGFGRGETFRDWPGEFVVGRAADCNLPLKDEVVSTRHARFIRAGNECIVEDMKSANGTFVDGVRVERVPLKPGQKIRIGGTTIVYQEVNVKARRRRLRLATLAGALILAALVGLAVMAPEDEIRPAIENARKLAAAQKYQQAIQVLERLPANAPQAAQISELLAGYRRLHEAHQTMDRAEQLAAAEDFEEALRLSRQVLASNPGFQRAAVLGQVLESVREADTALRVQNWTGALTHLQRAHERFPDSAILASYIERARAEASAQRQYDRGREAWDRREAASAAATLSAIPEGSFYHAESQRLLRDIEVYRRTEQRKEEIRNALQAAHYDDALALLDRRDIHDAFAAEFAGERTRVARIKTLWDQVDRGEQGMARMSLAEMDAYLAACDDYLKLETSEAYYGVQRATALSDQVRRRIGDELARGLEEARTLVARNNIRGAVDKATELEPYAKHRDDLRPAINGIREEWTRQCQDAYRRGLQLEEARRHEEAREAFNDVLRISKPGDDYYDRAAQRLRRLP